MTKHTPGPWTLQPIGDETECNILGGHRELIATVADYDAHLIAAAPDLLEALERIQIDNEPFEDSHSPYWTLNEDDVERIRDAIAKARGEIK